MMRELFSKKLGLAVLAGLGLSSMAASANAALITFDLRVAGGGPKNVSVAPGVPQVVNLELYAVVQNSDGDRTNDGFQAVHGSLLSVEGATGPVGNLAPVVFTSLIDGGVSQAGLQQNLDANADLEVGSSNPSLNTNYIVANTGTSAKFGTGSGAGPTEFFLGTTSYSYTGVGVLGTTSNLNLSLRVKTDGLAASRNTVLYVTDGLAHAERGDDTDIALGSPVAVTVVPEPAALGLLGVAGLAALRRRRA